MPESPPITLYIHWPFCLSKCPYCDFNSHVQEEVNQQEWLEAYKKEFSNLANTLGKRQITSVFFGGGTPSLMNAATIDGILSHIFAIWPAVNDIEITLEANPTSVEADKFNEFYNAGINRLSLGIQALNDRDLKFLGRKHSAKEALQAFDIAQNIFSNISFDLIYARPEQTLIQWQDELVLALNYNAKHMSLYQLTIEKGTVFYAQHTAGEFKIPKDSIATAMYEYTEEKMTETGLPPYEISNYAAAGKECRHNLTYWKYGEYLGIGPGAHSRVITKNISHPHRKSLMMVHSPKKWLTTVTENGNGIQQQHIIDGGEMLEEFTIMGLRMKNGINLNMLPETSNLSDELPFNAKKLQILENEGFLERNATHLKATKKGTMVLNRIIEELLS